MLVSRSGLRCGGVTKNSSTNNPVALKKIPTRRVGRSMEIPSVGNKSERLRPRLSKQESEGGRKMNGSVKRKKGRNKRVERKRMLIMGQQGQERLNVEDYDSDKGNELGLKEDAVPSPQVGHIK